MKNIPIRQIQSVQQASNTAEGFSIRALADLLGGRELVHDFHRHDHYFVLALKKGAGTHEIDFIPYAVNDHSIFTLRPGQVHQLMLKAGCTGYLLQFNFDFYYPMDHASRQVLRKATNKNYCQLDDQRVERLFDILHHIYQEHQERQEAYQTVIRAELGVFFIELLRQRQQPGNTPTQQSLYAQERMDELSELLETHIAKYKQVSDYAGMMKLSAYQLNAITKQTIGKTCSEIINEYVILESKRQLLATSKQVSQIADALGYDDISYFIRFFKKHTGHTPEALRKLFK